MKRMLFLEISPLLITIVQNSADSNVSRVSKVHKTLSYYYKTEMAADLFCIWPF